MVPFAGLLAALEQIPDPRRRQGQRYSLAPLLLFAVLAVLAGATSYRRIRLFIGVHRERLNAAFGAGFRRAPAINTLRTLFHALDPTEIEAAFRAHAEQLGNATAAPGRRVIALDGETLRGSFEHPDDRAAAPVRSAFAGEDALILAHQEIAEGDEIAAAQALIERLGLRGVLFTADALHCQKNLRLRDRDRQRAPGAGEGQPAAPAREPGRPVRRAGPGRPARDGGPRSARPSGAPARRGLRGRGPAPARMAGGGRLRGPRRAPELVQGPPRRPVAPPARGRLLRQPGPARRRGLRAGGPGALGHREPRPPRPRPHPGRGRQPDPAPAGHLRPPALVRAQHPARERGRQRERGRLRQRPLPRPTPGLRPCQIKELNRPCTQLSAEPAHCLKNLRILLAKSLQGDKPIRRYTLWL